MSSLCAGISARYKEAKFTLFVDFIFCGKTRCGGPRFRNDINDIYYLSSERSLFSRTFMISRGGGSLRTFVSFLSSSIFIKQFLQSFSSKIQKSCNINTRNSWKPRRLKINKLTNVSLSARKHIYEVCKREKLIKILKFQ